MVKSTLSLQDVKEMFCEIHNIGVSNIRKIEIKEDKIIIDYRPIN